MTDQPAAAAADTAVSRVFRRRRRTAAARPRRHVDVIRHVMRDVIAVPKSPGGRRGGAVQRPACRLLVLVGGK